MKALLERIRAEGTYLGNGILKVDGFLNHRLEPCGVPIVSLAVIEHMDENGIQAR